jgi:hypothetical protein
MGCGLFAYLNTTRTTRSNTIAAVIEDDEMPALQFTKMPAFDDPIVAGRRSSGVSAEFRAYWGGDETHGGQADTPRLAYKTRRRSYVRYPLSPR